MGFERRPRHLWSPAGRTIVFVLACTSIACLLSEFYRLCPMRAFALFVFLPALTGLAALMVADLICGDRRLWRGVVIGCDARRGSADFAEEAASVLAGAGIAVRMLPPRQPTPRATKA